MECAPFNRRSLARSYAVTSSVIVTPAAAQSGPSLPKRSSITHCTKLSRCTGQRSATPAADDTLSRNSSVVAGVMLSTMVRGKSALSSIHRARAASRWPASCTTARASRRPLSTRLSQLMIVGAGVFALLRRSNASTRYPMRLAGACGSRKSWTMSGCARFRFPSGVRP